ncbi:hypothetical protein SI65_08230 [Aspergillus cristatus]|uniref:Uncharacterized protein n=1 Tax=Aspergillus cristatus TaxID=573508 RepID=A0A1E3B600_ASPCR|nr:hypothetical protein SI65_08230 [Aspergillus cristatus]
MAPVTRHSARGHAPGVPQLWNNHRIQDISALVKTRKLRKLEKPDKQTVGNPDDPTTAPPAQPPPAADMEVETQAPVTSPEPENPNEQLEFKLSKHASIALQARAMREKEEDREILELLTLLDKKVSSMEQRNLTRAASFSNALQSFVHNYFTQPNMPPPPRPNQTAKL